MNMDMSKDKQTLLEEYSDELCRIICKKYGQIKDDQHRRLRECIENNDDESFRKVCDETTLALKALLEILTEFDEKFPQYMAASIIFDNEVEELD